MGCTKLCQTAAWSEINFICYYKLLLRAQCNHRPAARSLPHCIISNDLYLYAIYISGFYFHNENQKAMNFSSLIRPFLICSQIIEAALLSCLFYRLDPLLLPQHGGPLPRAALSARWDLHRGLEQVITQLQCNTKPQRREKKIVSTK